MSLCLFVPAIELCTPTIRLPICPQWATDRIPLGKGCIKSSARSIQVLSPSGILLVCYSIMANFLSSGEAGLERSVSNGDSGSLLSEFRRPSYREPHRTCDIIMIEVVDDLSCTQDTRLKTREPIQHTDTEKLIIRPHEWRRFNINSPVGEHVVGPERARMTLCRQYRSDWCHRETEVSLSRALIIEKRRAQDAPSSWRPTLRMNTEYQQPKIERMNARRHNIESSPNYRKPRHRFRRGELP